MSPLSLATLVCFLTVVSAKTNESLSDAACAQCKAVEDVIAEDIAEAFNAAVILWLTSIVEIEEACIAVVGEECARLFEGEYVLYLLELILTIEDTLRHPCEEVFKCEPDTMYAIDPVNNPNLCVPCKQLVAALYSKLNIEKLVEESKDMMLEVCKVMDMSAGNCQKAADEAMENLDFPMPEVICQQAGLCSTWSIAT